MATKSKPKYFNSCTVERTALITYSTLNMGTGELKETGKQEWKTGPCSTPLFLDEECKTGICRACAKGWNHPNNYRADGPRPTQVENE